MDRLHRYLYIAFLLFLFACDQKKSPPLFELMEHTGILFNNTLKDDSSDNIFKFRNYYNGGGVAIGDINNDGIADVLLTSNMGDNKLFLNKDKFTFEDITAKSGIHQDGMWSTGAMMVDINGDGWLDIYICSSGHMSDGHRQNKLYINNHDLTFTESAAKYGLDISAYTTQVSFFDYDNDGDLDCFMIDNSPIPVNTLNNSNRRDLPDSAWPIAQNLKGGGDHLYRNDNGRFHEVTREAGIHGGLIGFGLGVSVGDLNGDGYADIFVSNDSYERDYLYINQKNGTFIDELEQRFAHTSYSSMGADIADINNDGAPELFTTDMLPGDDYRLKTLGSFDNIDLYSAKTNAGFYHQYVKNCLQLNDGTGNFREIANYSGVSASDWSWGALMFDMDNDGLADIFVCNGINKDLTNLDFMDFFANDVIKRMVITGKKDEMEDVLDKIPVTPMLHKAFKNTGSLRFSDEGSAWGFNQPSFANGAAYGDLDNDGDLDLVINNVNGPAFVYKNNSRETTRNHYLAISLKGVRPNLFAIGSKIDVYAGGRIFWRDLFPSRGFQSSVDYQQVIGLGALAKVDSMVITWPDRSRTVIKDPAPDRHYTIDQQQPHVPASDAAPAPLPSPLLTPVKAPFDKHIEDNYTDFYYERNLPKMLSREGPRSAVGDVNGDGLPDVFIAGTPGHAGQLYLQTATGFAKSRQPAFDAYSDFEDGAVLFLDVDQDKDLDLFIGPAGNNGASYGRQLQFRLFKNDGKGNFTLDASAFPVNDSSNTISAVACDFNHDGYPDLFVGGHNQPANYGAVPSSYIFFNDGKGHFTDVTAKKAPAIARIGMVTGALCTSLTNDGKEQLIICGEWMPPRIFSFTADGFTELHNTGLDGLFGWWQTIAAADVDGDGKKDLLLGNIGENFYLRPDSSHPAKCWVSDFDNNGILDKILTRTVDGKDMPVFLKHDLEMQVPSLKKQNLKHKDFAIRSIQELFSPAQLDNITPMIFNYPSSIIAINKGNGKFTIQKLPVMVQLSSVNAIRCTDVNSDGSPDLILGGNEFGFLPQFGRLDASAGAILLNNGHGQWSDIPADRSGLNLPGQIRDIESIPGKDMTYLLFLQNDEYPALYRIGQQQSTFVK
jgi:hypothetical protein